MPRVAQQPSCALPRVSVAMITYNHAPFIAQAIESVLMQETEFPVELVIGEDCSTDDTRKIVQDYAARYPHVIRPVIHGRNVGMHRNAGMVLEACRGEYIAFLEGDDYWTVPHKLQRQVEFLKENSQCVICCHRVQTCSNIAAAVLEEWPVPQYRKPFLTLETLLEGNIIPSCSAVVPKAALPQLPPDFSSLKMGDWPTWIFMCRNGMTIGYLDENMGFYRQHCGGVWMSLPEHERTAAITNLFELLSVHLECRYQNLCRKKLASLYFQLASHYASEANRKVALALLKKTIKVRDKSTGPSARNIIKLLFSATCPNLVASIRWLRKKLAKN